MSEDEVKILIQLLDSLSFYPKDAKVILNILAYLEEQVKQPDIKAYEVTVVPENTKVKITKR